MVRANLGVSERGQAVTSSQESPRHASGFGAALEPSCSEDALAVRATSAAVKGHVPQMHPSEGTPKWVLTLPHLTFFMWDEPVSQAQHDSQTTLLLRPTGESEPPTPTI